MSNNFFTRPSELAPVTKARSVDINNLAAAVDAGFDNVQTAAPSKLASFSGLANFSADTSNTVNVVTFAASTNVTALTDGMQFRVKLANGLNGAASATIAGLGTFPIRRPDGSNPGGEYVAGQVVDLSYVTSGAGMLQLPSNVQQVAGGAGLALSGGSMTGAINEAKGAAIASAVTVDLQNATGNLVHITGSVAIYNFTLAAGAERECISDGNFAMVHSATLDLPGKANISTIAGDRFTVRGDGTAIIVTKYQRANGLPVSAPGNGGAAGATGNVVLTATSPGAQSVNPSAAGWYVTLPDATTMNKGVISFLVSNTSPDYDMGIKDSAGNKLGWVRPNSSAMIGLADNAAAAGVWSLSGVEKTGVTVAAYNAAFIGGIAKIRRLTLDANRTLFFFLIGNNLYAIAHDANTNTFGGLYNYGVIGTGSYDAVLTANSGQALLTYIATNGTTLNVYVLTITGTTISNSASTTTACSALSGIAFSLAQLGASGTFILAYSFGSASGGLAVRAIVLSGLNIGPEVVFSSSYTGPAIYGAACYSLDATHGMVVFYGNGGMNAQPVSVAGSTVTAGTPGTINSLVSQLLRFLPKNANGNIPFVCQASGGIGVHLITYNLSGSGTAFIAVGATSANAASEIYVDVSIVGNNSKVLLTYLDQTSLRLTCLLMTDSAGTPISQIATSSLQVVGSGANRVGSWTAGGNTAIVGGIGNSSGFALGVVDCSGATPQFIAQNYYANTSSRGFSFTDSAASCGLNNQYQRNYGLIGNPAGTVAYTASMEATVGDTPYKMALTSKASMIPMPRPLIGNTGTAVAGASANESWFFNQNFVYRQECAT